MMPEPEKPTENIYQLRARWLAKDENGVTKRDAMLEELRGRKGRKNPGPVDLRGISLVDTDLSGMDFSGYDLAGADLTGANLAHTKFSYAQMEKTTLYRCSMDLSVFVGANLEGADLHECQGENVSFGACNLKGANLFGARLEHCTFSKADLADADLRTARLGHSRFCESSLCRAALTEADLQHADLAESDVNNAMFNQADLKEAHLRGIRGFETATWVSADIRQVDFCGAYLVRRHIMDENYLYEFRNRGRKYEIIYRFWQLTSDCGRSMTRWGLSILFVVLLFGLLYMLVEVDYGDHKTLLSPFYFSVVTMTTLGYGDVLPASIPAQVIVILEVIAGYMALGGMLSIFANKMARRAE